MKKTDKFEFTTYHVEDDKSVANKDVFNSIESNFDILDDEAARTVNIPLVANGDGTYQTTMTWEEIEHGIEERDLLYIDIEDSVLPLMVCDIGDHGYSLLFGYTNIINGVIATRAVDCIYDNTTEEMQWRDIDRELEIGPQVPIFSSVDEGRVLCIKNNRLTFVDINELVKSELLVQDDGKCNVVYNS